jgi:hypothetical protein
MHAWQKYPELFRHSKSASPRLLSDARAEFPWVPGDYWAFVENVGYGQMVGLVFYEGPVQLGDLGLTDAPHDYAAVADDMSGGYYGFVSETKGVVALETTGWVQDLLGQTFDDFLTELAEELI